MLTLSTQRWAAVLSTRYCDIPIQRDLCPAFKPAAAALFMEAPWWSPLGLHSLVLKDLAVSTPNYALTFSIAPIPLGLSQLNFQPLCLSQYLSSDTPSQ